MPLHIIVVETKNRFVRQRLVDGPGSPRAQQVIQITARQERPDKQNWKCNEQ